MTFDFLLHKLVFCNDVDDVTKFLSTREKGDFGTLKDPHGNTPLHLAVMLGHTECTKLLLDHNHPVNEKNGSGWTVIQEAISYGDKGIITSLLKESKYEKRKEQISKKPEVTKAFESLVGDFYVKMVWDFQSSISFVSKVLPSDVCQIYRKGKKVRMDSTLQDFTDRHWVRRDLTYIVDFEVESGTKIFLLDNRKKIFTEIQQHQTDQEIEESIEKSVNKHMGRDITENSIKTSNISISRMPTRRFTRQERTKPIGQFTAELYKVTGLTLVTRKRREHLTELDIKKNKSFKEALKRGENSEKCFVDCADSESSKRESLPSPPSPNIAWEEYLKSPKDSAPNLGRVKQEKTNRKEFEATLGMSKEFPIKLEDLLPILESLGPKAKIFAKLRNFITWHLPPGFPVRIDIPIFPTVKATVSFPEFEVRDNLPESMFSIPADYKMIPKVYFEMKKSSRTLY